MNRRTFIASAAAAAVVRKLPAPPPITAAIIAPSQMMPTIPAEVWAELTRMQTMNQAILNAQLDIYAFEARRKIPFGANIPHNSDSEHGIANVGDGGDGLEPSEPG